MCFVHLNLSFNLLSNGELCSKSLDRTNTQAFEDLLLFILALFTAKYTADMLTKWTQLLEYKYKTTALLH